MTLIFETNLYRASRDRFGHWLLISRKDGRAIYLQGDDARDFAKESAHVPAAYLDLAIDAYSEVMQ